MFRNSEKYRQYLLVQYLGSSLESPQSLTLLQNELEGTHFPLLQVNSDFLHLGLGVTEEAETSARMKNMLRRTKVAIRYAVSVERPATKRFSFISIFEFGSFCEGMMGKGEAFSRSILGNTLMDE